MRKNKLNEKRNVIANHSIQTALICLLLCTILVVFAACGGSADEEETTTVKETTTTATAAEEETTAATAEYTLTVDESITYQTIESFGASGAWWSQDVGGWTNEVDTGEEAREYIARLLFDPETGIGLTNYRYNLAAGYENSTEGITDSWRRGENFETEPGVYDWTKDENSVWFLKKAVEYGVEDVVFFVNSPIERLTITGSSYGAADEDGNTSNLAPENYEAFAKYVLDVTEHFVTEEGIPVTTISPINEPQWEWTSGQEGCHYTTTEMVDVLKVFINAISERDALDGVTISAPESGEWSNTGTAYFKAILADEELASYFTTLDSHSYWTDASGKKSFMTLMSTLGFTGSLRTTEWCEMTNGKNVTMASALPLAEEINDDLTILNVVSWQYWIAVSCYDYRDGLIYVNKTGKTVTVPKRLWAMGNYSKFIRPGAVRVDAAFDSEDVDTSAFLGTDGELIVVIINDNDTAATINLTGIEGYTAMQVHTTDADYDLECTYDGDYADSVEVTRKSVTTLVFTK
ncbi:MAG: hypothetical protein LUE29_00215 [Lachnospiraceae bacterium]|nr:hypothetical protein [Lachnospiraceae bacterium]